MKKRNLFITLIIFLFLIGIFLLFIFYNFQEEVENDLKEKQEKIQDEPIESIKKIDDGNYHLDIENSQFIWQASRQVPENYKNKGTIDFLSGHFTLKDNQIIEGEFVFDMKSLEVTDMTTSDSKTDLRDHLKSDKFFNVSEYAQASLSIKEGSLNFNDDAGLLYDIKADLTIKDISNEIDFIAMIYSKGDKNIVESSLSLDRTLWNIRYGSDKFFDLLADEIIDDIFNVSLNLFFDKK